MKQMKEKIKTKDIFDNEVVRGIIWSLAYTTSNVGLEQKHLRYLLMEEYATLEQIRNDPQVSHNNREIKNFLNKFRNSDRDFRGIIKNRSLLNYYLNHRLGEGKNGLGLVQKKGGRYFITPKGGIELARYIAKKNLEWYDNGEILPFYKNNGKIKYNQVFYGITKKEKESLTDEEKERLRKLQDEIFKSLLEMEKIIKKKKWDGIPQMAFVQCHLKSKTKDQF